MAPLLEAQEAADLLRSTRPADLQTLQSLAVGTGATSNRQAVLTQSEQLPESETVESTLHALETALSHLAGVEHERSALDQIRDGLLREALRYHAAAKTTACPLSLR